MEIIRERYDNITDFAKSLTRPVVGYITKKGQSTSFCGTESIEEANKLLKEGDTYTASIIQGAHAKKLAPQTKNTLYRSVQGFLPNIGAVMSGHPVNMYNIKPQTYRNTKIINLVYFIGASALVSAEDLAKEGRKLLDVIYTLESKGYRINLYAARCIHPKFDKRSKDITIALLLLSVKIKDSGKHLNISKIAYPVAHPSFFRRHCFLWSDIVCPEVTDTYTITDAKILAHEAEKIAKDAKWVSFSVLQDNTKEDILKRILD